MTLAEKIAGFIELWRMALPHVEPPSVQDAARWCRYHPETVEKAILRAGRRFALDKITPAFRPDEAHRYVSAIAREETERICNGQ
jgi:hypothetical protein